MTTKRQVLLLSTALLALMAFAVPASATPAPVSVYGVHPGSPNGNVVVTHGETIDSIARRYDVDGADIAALNGLEKSYILWTGEKLFLPVPRRYTVGAEDTLYSISRMHGVGLQKLADANHLKPPYRLHRGQVLHIPHAGETAAAELERKSFARAQVEKHEIATVKKHDATVTAHQETHAAAGEKVTLLKKPGPSKPHQAFTAMLGKISGGKDKKDVAASRPPAKLAAAPREETRDLPVTEAPVYPSRRAGFVWPVRGQVISGYGPKEGGLYNDGINIAAPRGTPVAAAADGVVAYVGNTLRSYGNLVLIRHGQGVVTAYAHLNTVTVRQGMHVTRGQAIGSVGSTGTVAHAQLHFEVRRGGEKINPQQYLG